MNTLHARLSKPGVAQNAEAPKKPKNPKVSDQWKPVEAAVAGKDSTLEPKYDGIRLLVEVDDQGVVHTYTRTGNEQTGKLPEIEADLFANLPPNTILDGEAVGFVNVNGVLTQDWGKAQSVLGSGVAKAKLRSKDITLVIFDVLEFGGNETTALPFKNRREFLEKLFATKNFKRVILTPQLAATDENHDDLVAKGYEGSMVKWLDSPYAVGQRGRGWFKIKATDEADVVIMGFKPGESSFRGMVGAIEFGQFKTTHHPKCAFAGVTDYDPGVNCGCPGYSQLVHRGRCSGMTMQVRQDMTANQSSYIGKVISLAYMTIMPSGALRHPQYKRTRDDKPAQECLWTQS